MMKRRTYSLVLSLLLMLSLSACGEAQGGDSAGIDGAFGASSDLSGIPAQGLEDGNGPGAPQSGDSSQALSNSSQDLGNDLQGKSDEGNRSVDEDGWYASKEEVALYIHLYGDLPDNYVTKSEAEDAGWSGGNVERYTGEGTAIGGDRFGNREGLLPKEQGRTYTECDIDTPGENSRGAKRIVFSNDGLIYYTEDHYETFELLYGEP